MMHKKWDKLLLCPIKTRLLDAINDMIKKECLGQTIDSSPFIIVRDSFAMFNHEFCMEKFEKQFIESFQKYYLPIIHQFFNENDILAYIAFAHHKFMEQKTAAIRYFKLSDSFVQKLSDVLVTPFQEHLLDETQKLMAQRDVKCEFFFVRIDFLTYG